VCDGYWALTPEQMGKRRHVDHHDEDEEDEACYEQIAHAPKRQKGVKSTVNAEVKNVKASSKPEQP
jgi:hypothetical protein